MSNSESLLIKDAAKLLQIGSQTLYGLLHQKGYIAAGTNYPRDDMVKAGYFKSEQRTKHIKRPGDAQATPMPYWVTIVTEPAGLDFLRGIVDEYKAANTPAPGAVKLAVTIPADTTHAIVRYTQLHQKERLTPEEGVELVDILKYLDEQLPLALSASLARSNRKLLAHPKFQTAFHPARQAH